MSTTLTVSAEDIALVRRRTNEPTTEVYSDAVVTSMIQRHPCPDRNGERPFQSTIGVTPLLNPIWIPTYDLYLVAAEIWDEKAAALAPVFGFTEDNASYSRQQQYDHAVDQAKICRKHRVIKSIELVPDYASPPQTDTSNVY